MKTTVELSEPLLREAREYAARQGIPLRQVIENALQMALRRGSPPSKRFRLKTVTTKGERLAIDGDWNEIRSLIYQGHGG